MIFRHPSLNLKLLPDFVCYINQILEARLLGVIISDKFSLNAHVKYSPSICSHRFFFAQTSSPTGLTTMGTWHCLFSYCCELFDICFASLGWISNYWSYWQTKFVVKEVFPVRYSNNCWSVSKFIDFAYDELFASFNKPSHCAHLPFASCQTVHSFSPIKMQ